MNNNTGFQEPVIEKTKIETDKKCPNCGGILDFNPVGGNLKCPFCDSTFEINPEDDIQISAKENDFSDAENLENCDWGVATKTVICKSCGGESVYDELTLASVCPYCGSNQVMEEESRKSIAPGGVCTFKIDSKKASTNFYNWIKRKFFCPKAAKESAKPEAFKGIYIPIWTFDADTVTVFKADYGIDRSYKDKDGNTRTTTDWYTVSGSHRQFIDDHVQIATDRYDSATFNSILPFKTAENLTYNPKYIAGFASEKYSIGLGASWERAKTEINNLLLRVIAGKIKSEHNADRVKNLKVSTAYNDIKYKYLLAPVWLSSFNYKGKIYRFMVNGETGKVAGKTPVSGLKVLLTILVILALLGLFTWFVNQPELIRSLPEYTL